MQKAQLARQRRRQPVHICGAAQQPGLPRLPHHLPHLILLPCARPLHIECCTCASAVVQMTVRTVQWPRSRRSPFLQHVHESRACAKFMSLFFFTFPLILCDSDFVSFQSKQTQTSTLFFFFCLQCLGCGDTGHRLIEQLVYGFDRILIKQNDREEGN